MGNDMARMVKRLRGLDIDEISLVDRPANQHGLVEITKRDEESAMGQTLFDAEGYQVDPSTLSDGQYVYDESGNEYVNVGKAAEDIADVTEEELDEADLAGRIAARRKRAEAMMLGGPGMEDEFDGDDFGDEFDMEDELDDEGFEDDGFGDEVELDEEDEGFEEPMGPQDQFIEEEEEEDMDDPRMIGKSYRARGSRRVSKSRGRSIGQQVLEDLSKSMNDSDRDNIVSKAIDQMASENARLVSKSRRMEHMLGQMAQQKEFEEYVDLAKSYGYAPGEDTEIAEMLYTVSKSNPEMLPVLDRVLTSQSEFAKSHLEEIGYMGDGEYDSLAQVYGMADEVVAKGDGAFSQEQAITELFANNPEMYDDYESNRY